MSEWDDRRHWARSTAERVIKTQQLDETPVNPQDVAERLGLRVEFTTELDQHVSGKLTYRSGEPIILVNGHDSRRRKRFTIAHEIGHYLDGAEEDVARDGVSNLEEFGCNEFAASLLMPERWFRADVREGYTNAELSAMYDMSLSAVRVRRETLGI